MTGRSLRPFSVAGLVWNWATLFAKPGLAKTKRSAILTLALCLLAVNSVIYVQIFDQVAWPKVYRMSAREKAAINTRTPADNGDGRQAHCLLWRKHTDTNLVRPQIKLDPGKFLYPGLIKGPNNQIVGLWQSIYLAIRLNRTLVLPTFYEHLRTENEIPPEQFIDLERLAAFVSVVPVEHFREACNGSFQVVFMARANTLDRFQAYEKETGMKLLNMKEAQNNATGRSNNQRLEDWKLLPHIKTFPGKQYHIKKVPWLSPDGVSVNRVYNTPAPCALYSAPFRSFVRLQPPEFSQPLRSHFSAAVSNEALYQAAIDSVRRPAAVVGAVMRFINEVYEGKSYVAVHWRFDEDDWRGGLDCKNFAKRRDLLAPCLDLPNITAADVATGIVSSLDKDNVSRSAWRHFYIAAVPTLRDFAEDVAQEVRKLNQHVVETKTPSLGDFLDEQYGACRDWAGWKNKKETLALAELELLSRSEWFFSSISSTFSINARMLRRVTDKSGMSRKKYERSILAEADSAYKNRIRRVDRT